MLQRASKRLKTKKQLVHALSRLAKAVDKVKSILDKDDIRLELESADRLQLFRDRRDLAFEEYDQLIAESNARVQSIEQILKVLQAEFRILERRPETADEMHASTGQAKKLAVLELTKRIVWYWKNTLRLPIDLSQQSPCIAFATAVYSIAGDAGASADASVERLRPFLPPSVKRAR